MIYPDLASVADRFDTLLIDAYGVFWGGSAPIPGSLEAMAAQVRQGKQVCILSNTTMIGQANIDAYTRKGLTCGIHYTDVVTSGDVFYQVLLSDNLPFPGHSLYPFGLLRWDLPAGSPFRLTDNIDAADMVFFGTPQLRGSDLEQHPQWRPLARPVAGDSDRFDVIEVTPFLPALKDLVARHLPAVSTNPDLVAREGEDWIIRQGTFAQTYRDFGGQVVEYGKPYPDIYRYAFQKLGITPSARVAMIGDTFRTDIRGALDNGLTPVWCVDTGVACYEQSRGRSLEEQAGGSLDGIVLIHHL